MSGSLVLLPLRLGVRATSFAVRGARELIGLAAGLAGLTRDEAPLPDFHAAPDGPPTRTEPPPRPVQTATAAPPEARPDEEELAEPRAQDGAGAQVRVAEPWSGYEQLRAADVIGRLAEASPEELATIELYELSRRKRKTVIAAAQRELSRRR